MDDTKTQSTVDEPTRLAIRDAVVAACNGRVNGWCGSVAVAVAEVFGGEVVAGGISWTDDWEDHYWNRLADGDEVDFTSQQFGGDGIAPLANRVARRGSSDGSPWVFEDRYRATFERVRTALQEVAASSQAANGE